MPFAASALAFFGVLFMTLGISRNAPVSRTRQRLDALEAYGRGQRPGVVTLALRNQGSAWAQRTLADLDRAGLALKLHEYVTLRILCAVAGFLFIYLLAGGGSFTFFLSLVVGGLGYMLPAFWVRSRINRQVHKLNAQLEEMITMVSNSLRAGFGLTQSFDLAAQQLQPPISSELRRLLRDINLGATLEEAVKALGERVASPDLDVVVTAILIQRSVGSNLSEVLDNVAHTIRERARIKGEVATLTTQKRLAGWIVGMLPPAFVLLMFAINFDYMKPLFTTGEGRFLTALAAALDIIGLVIVRRIVSVDV